MLTQTDLLPEEAIQEARAQGRAWGERVHEKGDDFDPSPEDALEVLDTSGMDLPDHASALARRTLMFELLHAAKERFAAGHLPGNT